MTSKHAVLGKVVLRDGRSSREDLIDTVVAVFEDMGCKNSSEERAKLISDEQYFQAWVLELPLWCPSLAEYVDRVPRRSQRKGERAKKKG